MAPSNKEKMAKQINAWLQNHRFSFTVNDKLLPRFFSKDVREPYLQINENTLSIIAKNRQKGITRTWSLTDLGNDVEIKYTNETSDSQDEQEEKLRKARMDWFMFGKFWPNQT